jgi:hypothetical protein
MFGGLFVASLIGSVVQLIKESCTPVITAQQWGNKELMHQDIMNGMSVKEQIKNAEKGRYILTEKYPESHRNPKTGQIIIENSPLWREDLAKYGAYQTSKWVKQGKYNLTPEELEKERERLKKHFEYLYNL